MENTRKPIDIHDRFLSRRPNSGFGYPTPGFRI